MLRLSLETILTTENPLFEMCTSFRVRYGIAILPICTSMKNFLFRSHAKSFGNNLNKINSAKSTDEVIYKNNYYSIILNKCNERSGI
jgi:hypothetical protein